MTFLHTKSKMPNSNVPLVINIKHTDKKIFTLLPFYMSFCRTTNDSLQVAFSFYASNTVQLVFTRLGYDTVLIGSPLPPFQDSVMGPPLHTCTAPVISISLTHQPVCTHINDQQQVRL
jgi:hypothetical protein